MNLNLRPCMLGASINGRREKHGEENVPAFDIPLKSIMLSKDELNELKKDPSTWDRWFNERKDGLPEPADVDIRHFALDHVYENSVVKVIHALADDKFFEFENCKLTKLKLIPAVGGLTELRVTLRTQIGERHGICKWMDKDCRIELEFGDLEEREKDKAKKRQPELNLQAEPEKPKRTRTTHTGDTLN